MKNRIFELNSNQLSDYLMSFGLANNEKLKKIKRYIYQRSYIDQNLNKYHGQFKKNQLEEFLNKTDFSFATESNITIAKDGTQKFQTVLEDGQKVETVILSFRKHPTICISTQVGCGMNCSFCYTATLGLKRNLKSHEIVSQYLLARKIINQPFCMPNIVFMGQGEPLHNFDELKLAIQTLTCPSTLGLGHRQITVSTVGYMPGLQRIHELPAINIALSLHSTIEEKRQKLIPLAKVTPLNQILPILATLALKKNQYIIFEYLLVANFNDGEDDLDSLALFIQKFHDFRSDESGNRAILNIIPFNPFPGTNWKRPSEIQINIFTQGCVKRNIRTMTRKTKGLDIMAACGQLKPNEY